MHPYLEQVLVLRSSPEKMIKKVRCEREMEWYDRRQTPRIGRTRSPIPTVDEWITEKTPELGYKNGDDKALIIEY